MTALSLLGGCGIIGGGDKKPKTPTVGTRIPVLAAESGVEVDPALANVPVMLPPAVTNTDWTQPGGNAAKSMVHLTLGQALGRAFSVKIDEGNTSRGRLAAQPVVAEGRVYTIDTVAVVRAVDAQTGARIWSSAVGSAKDREGGVNFINGEPTGNRIMLYGGGVSYDEGRIYATSGIGDVAAFDARTGAEIWRVRPGGPLRGAPTIANANVYVVSQDNQLFALNPADGSVRWSEAGAAELAGVFGSAAPAAAQGTVVAGFSSGELNAYRYENGQTLWQDALTRTSISTTVGAIADINAEPVIDSGRVYAIGQGGRMVAIELISGQRVWEISIAGIASPWVAGEWIFVVTDEAQLLAIARDTGKVRWMTQLPRWRDQKDKEGPIQWVGPILAGDRLILANSRGHLVNVSPVDGSVQSTVDTDMSVSLPPVVANNTLYVLHDDGTLTAWR